MNVAWVIGRGGLLGGAVSDALDPAMARFAPAEPFAWNDPGHFEAQMGRAVSQFAERAAGCDTWQIHWTAGRGSFASTAEMMAQESASLATLMDAIRRDAVLGTKPGCIALASSAGAIYAGSGDFIVTESTAPAPTTPYAAGKLHHEAMLKALADDVPAVRVFVARISTIYGAGQTSRKAQGLLTHIARCVIRGEPVHIYVPYDTIRDYITVGDAAREMTAGAGAAIDRPGSTMQLIASEQPTTIAEIIGIFRRIAKRNPRVITSANQLSALYTRRIQFRSVAHDPAQRRDRTPLLVGISQLFAQEKLALASAKLPPARAIP